MPILSGLAVVWQDTGAVASHDMHLLTVFVALIFIALLVQAAGVLIAGVYAAKLLNRIDGISKNVDEKLAPLLVRTNDLMRDLTPKINGISTNVEQMSYTVRAKVDELGETVSQLNETVREVNGRTRRQVVHVDGIVTEALYATEEISRTVQDQIRKPVRQIVGVLAGLQAGLATLIEKSPFGKRDRPGPYDL